MSDRSRSRDRPSRPCPSSSTSPRGRKKPPRHLADLDARRAQGRCSTELGLPGFRAKQLSTHYFARLVDDPAEMTDLPAAPARRARRRAAART